ncbi:TPA: hypothetical protein ACKRXM_003274 [Proteus mirabilis]|uniref:hypothetical protein n=1 Tax=Proteus mirabilis TaxID=584 RepID=UPI0018C72B44|nr:hypothetical protein [Proteus mirabilis]MBG2964881.1 hypothetical protein [Proteus mirabilis]HBC8821008.1 hypothetical protein [Proteus mirabilis]HEK0689491.1 hypothetical protein [Proteus mirabilis]HEK2018700.1 hypothetical protein [Proteus mirabilis]
MTQEEKENFIFNQTVIIISGRLATMNAAPTQYIKDQFRNIYEELAKEYKKTYIARAVK